MKNLILKHYGSQATKFVIDPEDPVGTFTADVSVFGNVDSDGDIVHPGAFSKTVSEHAGVFPLVWQHQIGNPIGVTRSMAETAAALAAKAEFNMQVRQGSEAYHLMKQGALRGFSFSARVVKSDPIQGGGLNLRELQLFEVSAVTLPANTLAQLTGIKSMSGSELAGIINTFEDSHGDAIVRDAIDALSALLARKGEAATGEAEPGDVSTLREFIGDLRKQYSQP